MAVSIRTKAGSGSRIAFSDLRTKLWNARNDMLIDTYSELLCELVIVAAGSQKSWTNFAASHRWWAMAKQNNATLCLATALSTVRTLKAFQSITNVEDQRVSTLKPGKEALSCPSSIFVTSRKFLRLTETLRKFDKLFIAKISLRICLRHDSTHKLIRWRVQRWWWRTAGSLWLFKPFV